MRTTAIMNLKGGVGKTTTAIYLPAILARDHGKKCLVIDLDSQCNSTAFWETGVITGTSVDVLTRGGGMALAHKWIRPTGFEGVDLLPASEELMELDLSQLKEGNRVKPFAFRELLADLASAGLYDFVFIDCPPSFSAACAAALMAADDVLIPTKLDAFSMQGMGNVLRQIKGMQSINPKLRVAGILPTMAYKAVGILAAEDDLRKQAPCHVYRHIRASKTVDAMTFSRKALASPRGGSEQDYRRFVKEYLKGGVKHGL